MFSSRKANNLINRIHEGFVRIVTGDYESNYEKKIFFRKKYLRSLPNFTEENKLANSLSEFKSKIKTWKCDVCVCQLYRPFLPNLGFI